MSNPDQFEREVVRFVDQHSKSTDVEDYEEPFLFDVAQPMLRAYQDYKGGKYRYAIMATDQIAADDWRIAARGWLERRAERVGK